MNAMERYAINQLVIRMQEESAQASKAAERWQAAVNAPDAEGCERDEAQHARGRATGLLTAAKYLDELLTATRE